MTAPTTARTELDRCDRCGAVARTRVVLPTGGELLFCAHHAREHAARLQQLGAVLIPTARGR